MYQLRIAGNYEKVQVRFFIEILSCPRQEPCSNANALVIWEHHKTANPPIFVLVLGTPNRDECHGFAIVERDIVFV
jgi:hypothetical protein